MTFKWYFISYVIALLAGGYVGWRLCDKYGEVARKVRKKLKDTGKEIEDLF